MPSAALHHAPRDRLITTMENQIMTPTPPPTASSAPLARIEGASLYTAPAGGPPLMRDVEIATAVGLSRPRDVRRVFARLIDSGAVAVVDGARIDAQSADSRPLVVRAEEHVQCGRGRMQPSTVYYADERAAGYVLLKMRTTGAADVQRRIADVFHAVRREVPQAPALPPAPPALAEQLPAEENLATLPADVARASLLVRIGESSSAPEAARARAMEAALQLLVGTLPALPASAPVEVQPAPFTSPAQATAAPPAPPVEAAAEQRPLEEPAPEEDGTVIPASWVSATTLAARASARLQKHVTPNAIGRAVSALKIRERGIAVARCETIQKQVRDYSIDVAAWRYEPGVLSEIVDFLRASAGPKKATPRPGAVAGGAAVLAALADSSAPTTPRPMSRPGQRPPTPTPAA